jgi:hypothetical protein
MNIVRAARSSLRSKVLSALVIAGVNSLYTPAVMAADDYDAGYEWAEYQSVDDPARCYEMDGRNINDSAAFTAGCLQYLQDHGITEQDPGQQRHSDDQDSSQDGG